MSIPTRAFEANFALFNNIFLHPGRFSAWGVQGDGWILFPASVNRCKHKGRPVSMMLVQDVRQSYLLECGTGSPSTFIGTRFPERSVYSLHGKNYALTPVTPSLIYELCREDLPWAFPKPLGSGKPSMGWGNRTSFSTEVVLATEKEYPQGSGFNIVTAQNSIRENQILERHNGFKDVMTEAILAKIKMGYRKITGSDADHLKTTAEIDDAISAGFTGFTIDPSAILKNNKAGFQNNRERTLEEIAASSGLMADFKSCCAKNKLDPDFVQRVMNRLEGRFAEYSSGDSALDQRLIRATAVKFADSWSFIHTAHDRIAESRKGLPFDFEVSFDETSLPTPALAHLLTADELIRRKVKITRLAVRYVGRFEKTTPWIPPQGQTVRAFAADFAAHQKIAGFFGYLQSIHSGSGKYNIYPYCKKAHVKTSGDISRPLMLALAENNFDAFCRLFPDIVAEAIETKKLYGAVSSPSNDFAKLLGKNPAKMGQKTTLQLLEQDVAWRTLSHYAYGMYHKAHGTFGDLLFEHRDSCAKRIAAVLNAHRRPLYAANGFPFPKSAPIGLKTREGAFH